jgi:hypothetical protein
MIYAFLLAGQSNMAGRGDLTDVPVIEDDKILMLRNGRWIRMSEPINPDRAVLAGSHGLPVSGACLAASFARDFAASHKVKIGLIPCADGGSGLDEWQPGELLYDHAVCQATLAARTARLAGVLWHQGENDSGAADKAASYEKRFLLFFNQLKKDLDQPQLPLLLGELAHGFAPGVCPWAAEINQALARLAQLIPACGTVSARDLTLKPDGVHFDAISLRTFGSRYFAAYEKIRGPGLA